MRSLWISLGLTCVALLGCADDPEAVKDCAGYCSAIQQNCTGDNQQYATPAQCLESCEAFEPGRLDIDTTGNSAACRAYHAGVAAGDPVTHCVHAGPGGAGVCGSDCEGFCTIALASCDGAFASLDACLTECAAFPATVKYNSNVRLGNTLACRLYHVAVASDVPVPHCSHITTTSTPETCGGP
jgi:hypothetical protein